MKSNKYQFKATGKTKTTSSGVQRDASEGKLEFVFLLPFFEKRIAAILTEGAKKYGDWNFTQGQSLEDLETCRKKARRHFFYWLEGDESEDHAAQLFANLMFYELYKGKIRGEITDNDISMWRYGITTEKKGTDNKLSFDRMNEVLSNEIMKQLKEKNKKQ
jgi:hypothetical protein